MKIIYGTVSASEAKIVIIVARFNDFINQNLLSGALDTLKRIGNIQEKNITVVWVPGSYEFPITILNLAKLNKYSAIIVLGTIIKGKTFHFEYISHACNNGISNISIKYNIPVSFGILIVKNIKQAIERSGIKMENQGNKAALTALEMINILKNISKKT